MTTLATGLLQQQFVVGGAGLVLFVEDWTRLIAYGAEGRKWQSERLADDDLRILDVDGDLIRCVGYFGSGGDRRFAVDLWTGLQRSG